MRENKLKVLISAYACEPNKGSEPGVGWNWAKQIAKFAEVWVITRTNNRNVIEEELKKSPISNLHFLYYDVPKWLSFWKKKKRGLYLYYLLWQIGAYRLAKTISKHEKFDVVHHLTFGNIWLPTFMPLLNVPFIWGPIGGGEQVPKIFRKDYLLRAKIQEFIRDIILASLKVNPFFIYACKKSSLIITRTKETLKIIPQQHKNKIVKMIETGVDINNLMLNSDFSKSENIQIITVGRLIYCKGFDLAIKAFAKAFRDLNNVKLIIVGDGSEKKRLQKICVEENIADKAIFKGHLTHDNVLKYMAESKIFLFPSLKEGGAWVFFEAMSLGLPIICLDIAGPHDIVTDQCGIKIKPLNPEQTINDLADAILRLAKDPDLRKRMGEAGRKRIEEYYSWDNKGDFIQKVYQSVINC